VLAAGPYYCGGDYCSGTNAVRVLLAAGGDYVIGAGGFTYDYGDQPIGGVTGPYSLSSSLVTEDVTGCETVFLVPGVTTTQRIDTTDCTYRFHASNYYYDAVSVQFVEGRTYTISMSSTEFDTYLELRSDWGGILAANDDVGETSDSQITFTPTWSGRYVIAAGTYKGATTGSYTLTVQ